MLRYFTIIQIIAMLFITPARAVDLGLIATTEDPALSLIDLARGRELHKIALDDVPQLALAAHDIGGIFVLTDNDPALYRFETDGVQTFPKLTLGGAPRAMLADSSRFNMIISDYANDRLWVIDPNEMRIRRVIPTGRGPLGLALSPDRDWIALALTGADKVVLIDAAHFEIGAEFNVGRRPVFVAFGPDRLLYAINSGDSSLSVIDPNTLLEVRRIALGAVPRAITFTDEMGFVSNSEDHSVTAFRLETGRVIETIPVGREPGGIATGANGDLVYVVASGSDELSVIDTRRLRVAMTIRTGPVPRASTDFIWSD